MIPLIVSARPHPQVLSQDATSQPNFRRNHREKTTAPVITVVPATSLYAAVLTLLFVALSFRGIGRRCAYGIPIEVTGNSALERAERVHANFAEYVPQALLLMLLVELAGVPAMALATAIIFTALSLLVFCLIAAVVPRIY